jgi:hypothetical protein
MKARILIFFVCIIIPNIILAHPIHISVVNLDVFPDSGKIDYSIRIFYEDFQTFINHKYNTRIDFNNQSRMTFKEQQSVIDYISKAFRIADDNFSIIEPEFLSWKIEDESIWLFFCAKLSDNCNKLYIYNELLLDLFSDQTNYVIYRNAEEENGIEFNKRKTEHGFKL